MAPVEWTVISGEQAEDVLSNLLYSEHTNAVRVRPSQGDLGIDVLVPVDATGEPFDVYQIKKFANTLGDSEKRQIKKSFRRFLVGIGRHQVPARDWYLVMPIDPTVDNYLSWFRAMPGEVIEEMFADDKLALTEDEEGRITAWRAVDERKIEWKGRTYCDNLAAKYWFVVDYYFQGREQTIRDAVKDVASLLKTDKSLPDSADAAGEAALVTPAEIYGHLVTLQTVLDTDPHYRYGISLDPTQPDIVQEPALVAATQVTRDDGQTVTVRVYQRFAEALNERPIELNFKFLTGHAAFDREAYEMWRKYGKELTAPAEVQADLPGGLGSPISDGVVQVSIGPAGQTSEARFRIRKPDGTNGNELPFSISVAGGTAGESGHGTDNTGFLDFDVISDRESRMGTWNFTRKKLVGAEIVAALPTIEFMQELRAPNTLQIATKYGRFQDYAEIPPTDYVFPDVLVDYLRALAIIQTVTATPILIPDLTALMVGEVEAVVAAAALVGGQTVVETWNKGKFWGDESSEQAGPAQGGDSREQADSAQQIDLKNEYQFLVMEKLIVTVGEKALTVGTVSSLFLSARCKVEDGRLFARPHRNNSLHKTFSPLPDAAGPYERHLLARVIGEIDETTGDSIGATE